MLDIVMPVPAKNMALVPDALLSIVQNTDVPFKVIVMIDGGAREDFEPLEGFLASFDRPWQLMHNSPAVGLNQTIREGLEECREKIVAIIGPQVRLMDPKWFGKIKQIFDREPITALVDTTPNTKSATLYPIKRAQNRPCGPGCDFVVVQTRFAKKTPVYGDVDPVEFWSRMAFGQGGAVWCAPGVRYSVTEHEDHELRIKQLGARS